MDIRHTPQVDQDKKVLRNAVIQTIADLDAIIGRPNFNNAQMAVAIKKLARHQKQLIKFIARNI